ncbi:hypothetical protein PIB30_063876 [Stylosanthes scabra]|uniref:Ribosome biogenesis protein NOP53 n=1 Tax=Stylosanthes scabra TaxID=79078 RepID=A0ABU6UL48_9FABA|nr:hypothetical protein [Stylosanthes scabra]
MGKKAKGSRKGKKAWRANISTEDIEDFFEKTTKDALSGGALDAVPSDALFFEDKSKDLAVKRKIEKHREKVLHVDSVLQSNQFVKPVPSSTLKKGSKNHKAVSKTKEANHIDKKDDSDLPSDVFDMWDDKGEDIGKGKKVTKPSPIPAVEVDPPGCSFNPAYESHRDVLACAVAQEMQKIYKDELGPAPVPLTVSGEPIAEEDRYFLDVDDGSDDEEGEGDNEDDASEKRPIKTKRVTRVELNKRLRRKEQQKKEAETKKLEELSKEIDSIPEIMEEIKQEDEEKKKKWLRREVAKQERLKARPPRIGKHKFEPAPVQVLLSDEINGSIRKLKGCCTLIKDRYKSLEKRGLIVPTSKTSKRRRK